MIQRHSTIPLTSTRRPLLTDSRKHDLITSWDAPCPNPDLPCDKILDLNFFGDSLTACLVLAGGDIIIVREEPQAGEDRIEIVGSVDAGIVAAKWSPDEELLCIVSKADTVIYMSRTFEGIKDVSMTVEDLNSSKHVNVGWGKKETQFKGKGAKALRDPTMPEKVDEGVLSSNDDHSACVSWRGDGAFVAINTVEGGKRRVIRVYSREGDLDSVSEPVDGLEGALSWRPAGNLIAGIQRLTDRVDVVFFERNGLRHGQFSLRLRPEQCKAPASHINLCWNTDSTVLTVSMPESLQLWTMGNYHWYLKQEINTSRPTAPSSYPIIWHPEKPLRLLSVTSGELAITPYSSSYADGKKDIIASHEFMLTTARGSTQTTNDSAAVAVIDGQNVLITPFGTANIPPPMALHSIVVDSNISDVAFNAQSSLIAILHQQGISVYSWDCRKVPSPSPVEVTRFVLEKEASSTSVYHQICFSGQQQLCVLERNGVTSQVHRYHHDIAISDSIITGSPAAISSSPRIPEIIEPPSHDSSRTQSTVLSDTTSVVSSSLADSPEVDPPDATSPQINFNAQNWNTNGGLSVQSTLIPISPLISPRNTSSVPGPTVSDRATGAVAKEQSTPRASVDNPLFAVLGDFVQDSSIHGMGQDYQGVLHSLATGDQISSFPAFLPWYSMATFEASLIPVGLSPSGHLYAGPRLLVKNCTSFLVTSAHLIFTTTSHVLKFVHITDIDSMYPCLYYLECLS